MVCDSCIDNVHIEYGPSKLLYDHGLCPCLKETVFNLFETKLSSLNICFFAEMKLPPSATPSLKFLDIDSWGSYYGFHSGLEKWKDLRQSLRKAPYQQLRSPSRNAVAPHYYVSVATGVPGFYKWIEPSLLPSTESPVSRHQFTNAQHTRCLVGNRCPLPTRHCLDKVAIISNVPREARYPSVSKPLRIYDQGRPIMSLTPRSAASH